MEHFKCFGQKPKTFYLLNFEEINANIQLVFLVLGLLMKSHIFCKRWFRKLLTFPALFKWQFVYFILSHTIYAYFKVINEINTLHRPYAIIL